MDHSTIAWLNRIGILLNFIAGFLLAPELIGIERIERLQKRIEILLNNLKISLSSAITRVNNFYSSLLKISNEGEPKRVLMWVILSITSISAIYGIIVLLTRRGIDNLVLLFFVPHLLVSLVFSVQTVVEFTRAESNHESSNNKLKRLLRSFWIIFEFIIILLGSVLFGLIIELLTPFYLIAFLTGNISRLLLQFVYFIVSTIFSKLYGDERLKSALVSLGIIIFIIGNFLQLIATLE